MRRLYTKECAECGSEFSTVYPGQLCCCDKCSESRRHALALESARRARERRRAGEHAPREVDSYIPPSKPVREAV